MKVRAAFWRFAHWRYNSRKPQLVTELACFTWSGFWSLVYVTGFIADTRQILGYLPFGSVVIGLPLAVGLLHRRIRLERLKGDNALYLKWLDANR